MKDNQLIAYKRMPVWTKETMPELVQQKHNTQVGTWGKLTILRGSLRFYQLSKETSWQPYPTPLCDDAGEKGIINRG